MIFFQRWKKTPHEGFWIFIPFIGDVGRAIKGRKRRVKSIFYFLFLEQVPLFFKFLYYGFGGTMLVCLLFVNFLFPIFCLIHTFIFIFDREFFLRDLRFCYFCGRKITPDPWQDQTQKQLTSQLPYIHPRPISSIFRPCLSFHLWPSFNYSYFFVCFFLW